jgi:hypothetical protein
MLYKHFILRKVAKYARLRQNKGYNSQEKPIFIYTKVEINSDIQQLLNDKLGYVEHKGVGQQKHIDQKSKLQALNNKNKSGCSLVWLGHQPATLTTRVRIPATAP